MARISLSPFPWDWFFGRDAQDFRDRILAVITSPRDYLMEELTSRSLFPWVDQIALSVVVSALGRCRPGPAPDGLDGEMTLHWHALPLFMHVQATHNWSSSRT